MRLLIIVICASLVSILLGYLVPERFGLLGVVALAVLFAATVILGIVQLLLVTRMRP
jgi:hypothetical protein